MLDTGVGKLNIGRDTTIDIILRSGLALDAGILKSFDAKPITKEITTEALDGINRYGVIPQGWALTMEADRSSPQLDNWWNQYERAYEAGDVIQNVTITHRIRETDGSISIWRFEGVALDLEDPGTWKTSDFVGQKLKAKASRRVKVA